MKIRLALLAAVLALVGLPALGEETLLEVAANHREVISLGLFPPQLVLRQQQQLGITDAQRKEIAGLVRDFQSSVTELQWELPNEQQKLRQILRSHPIDTETAIAQAKSVTEMESSFKLANFELLIAIKNVLTDEQVAMMTRGIRERMENRGERFTRGDRN